MDHNLNQRAYLLTRQIIEADDDLRVETHQLERGGQVFDFGVRAQGGLAAGLWLARVSMAGLGEASLVPGEIDGMAWPHVMVTTDRPVAACLLSQYAGWQISVGSFFAMGSGPMRAAAAVEDLFEKLEYKEIPHRCVGVLEGSRLPDDDVFDSIADRTGVPPEESSLLVAPTSSQAGNLQVVARSIETALHKLYELGFNVDRVVSGFGTAPLPPVAADDLTGIGRTNDAILYGATAVLWVRGDDESLAEVGPQVPSIASEAHGRPFAEIFEQAGRDFYKIDPHLFSPAEIVLQNLDTGRVHRFGRKAPEVLRASFGL